MKLQAAVIDFGSQYSKLIVRRLRELGYFAKLFPIKDLYKIEYTDTFILSGGPHSIYDKKAPQIDLNYLIKNGNNILGICYGMQILNRYFKGKIKKGKQREYGPAEIKIIKNNKLFYKVPKKINVWMSHSDTIVKIADKSQILAVSNNKCPGAVKFRKNVYGIQFHPEVSHTEYGKQILNNFIKLSGIKKSFNINTYIKESIQKIKDKVGNKTVVCAVSGGVDSTVLCRLLCESGVKFRAIFIDTGLLRKNEVKEVNDNFKRLGIKIKTIDASKKFISRLSGITDPEKKRKVIGKTFIDVFFENAGKIDILAQGTLYPDVIESATDGKLTSKIKTHHNRIKEILRLQKQGKIIEPLRDLFKDEVRELGKRLNIPDDILGRHPFPGPGLAVRIPGSIDNKKIKILQEADYILIDLLKKTGLYNKIWQAFCVLIPVKTVGVKGDERSYEYAVSVRCVESSDGMTASWAKIPNEVLNRISTEILNNVKGINRVLYDISTKPPASIEWE